MAPNCKLLKHILCGEWIDKWRVIHTVECYIGINMNKLLLYGVMWMTVTKEVSYKRVYTVQFHLYQVQKKAILFYL